MDITLRVRPAAVSGLFYPDDASTLAAQVQALLARADRNFTAKPPKALIVPHAGYIYSGPIAASAFVLLEPLRAQIRRVILMGPSHRLGFPGIALPTCTAFATPLGQVSVDTAALRTLAGRPGVIFEDRAHSQEHALEVQLPFLQTVLEDFSIVPLTLGDVAAETVAPLLDDLWGGQETLLLVSSDLSHYHPYAEACQEDQASLARIQALQPTLTPAQACGAGAINALILAARTHELTPTLLDARNSGDTAGDRMRVVGYAAVGFTPVSRSIH